MWLSGCLPALMEGVLMSTRKDEVCAVHLGYYISVGQKHGDVMPVDVLA